MSYIPFKPATLGLVTLKNINLHEIVPFIDWVFFFMAWRMSGKYEGIETVHDCLSCKVKWLQREIVDKNIVTINANFGIFNAYSQDDDIIIEHDKMQTKLPMLRQQHAATDGFCYSLADFIAPQDDYLGVFATTVSGVEEYAALFEKDDDVYRSILAKTLSDRLAEAAAEWVHAEVRRKYWGYATDENLSIKEMLKTQYSGIRPAVGYPSLPDQSIIFELDPILHFDEIGITLTENGAMFPNASVCGLYFAHPKSKYFMVGKVDEIQFADYAKRCGKDPQVLRKWMAANL